MILANLGTFAYYRLWEVNFSVAKKKKNLTWWNIDRDFIKPVNQTGANGTLKVLRRSSYKRDISPDLGLWVSRHFVVPCIKIPRYSLDVFLGV